MSSPAQEPKNSDEPGYVKEPELRRENRHAVTPYITVHKPAELKLTVIVTRG